MRLKGPWKFAVLFLAALLLLLSACGKKGPLTLTSWEKPPAPVLVGAYHRENRITISWSFPEDKEEEIQGFALLRATDTSFEKIAFPEESQRSYVDTDFKEGVRCRYKIVARNLRGVLSNDSNVLQVTPLLPPQPPQNISFKVEGNSTPLSWENVGQNVLYNVYKSFEKGKEGPSPVNGAPLTEPSFTDALDINRTAYYTIRSVVMSEMVNEGPSSAEIEVIPADLVPSAPSNLKAFPASDRVVLYWEAPPEPWVTKYRIYRTTNRANYSLIGETQIPTFVDMGQPSTKRDYKVTAVGPAKEGSAAVVSDVVFVPEE
jgi:fibronectin type 3 domain-containing protein